jgi:hypothetical protein
MSAPLIPSHSPKPGAKTSRSTGARNAAKLGCIDVTTVLLVSVCGECRLVLLTPFCQE